MRKTIHDPERTSAGYGTDIDVTPESFKEMFGFRCVSFGKSLPEKEKKEVLKKSYDAFLDLSRVLDISPEEISFGGELSISFALRGQGHRLAHYDEADRNINLPRTSGAGFLGYVWMHAFDHLLGRRTGLTGRMTDHITSISRNCLPGSFVTLMNAVRYKPLGDEKRNLLAEKYAEEISAGFCGDLLRLTGKWDDPALDARRKALIHEIVLQSAKPEKAVPFPLSFTRREEEYRKPSPELSALDAFQVSHGAGSICRPEICSWVNNESEIIRQKVQDFRNTIMIPLYSERTDYYRTSRDMALYASKAGFPSPDSPDELFVRAAAAYLADECRNKGIRNDYLNAGTQRAFSFHNGEAYFPSPAGIEKKAIDASFRLFMKDIISRRMLRPFEKDESVPAFPGSAHKPPFPSEEKRPSDQYGDRRSLDFVIAFAVHPDKIAEPRIAHAPEKVIQASTDNCL